jgi:hypothetical protein
MDNEDDQLFREDELREDALQKALIMTQILGGINHSNIASRRDNLFNGSGNKTLKYANGHAHILAFRDAKSGITTVNKQYQKVWESIQ